ncbi:MAG: elongation factor Ts [Planctomycetota bacterium]|nr:MAG: elongation factor Ts [Planctomycetota bacterium]
MAAITAAMVKSLRERSGLPMMDCKKALTESAGDEDKAIEILRKSGAAAAEKRAGREMAEGRIGGYVDKDRGLAAMVELQCETAPVSNNPDFIELANKIAKHTALTGTNDAETLMDEKFVDEQSVTIKDLLHEVLNRIRENMKVTRVICATGRVSIYVHHNGRVGVMLTVEGEDGDDELLNDVCMHIAAMQPEAVTREQLPDDMVEKEKEIVREQVLASGKPENLVDKIAMGKMNRWFSEHALIEQPFVKDDKKTVGKVLDAAGIKISGFTRWQVGEV